MGMHGGQAGDCVDDGRLQGDQDDGATIRGVGEQHNRNTQQAIAFAELIVYCRTVWECGYVDI